MKKLTFFLAVSLLMLLPQVSWAVGGVEGIGAPLPPNRIGDDGSFAMGTEKVIDGGLEEWTDDTPDNWGEVEEVAGKRDILKETVEIHGGSAAVKLQITDNDSSGFGILQYNLNFIVNKYYMLDMWYYFPTRTTGRVTIAVYNGGTLISKSIYTTNIAYEHIEQTFQALATEEKVYLQSNDETTTGIIYYDDISVRDVDLIARRYGGTLIGAIGMQQIDLWDKWRTPQ